MDLLSAQSLSRYVISQKLKRFSYGVLTCIWFIHGTAFDYQIYPWYISKHWYIPGISLVYAKTQKLRLINRYQIPDVAELHVCVLRSFIKFHKTPTKFNEALTKQYHGLLEILI